ncbi:PspC domain-containing protein [Hugenholtzia roseola]|uniref:PspC domain-containing protein n=1 Tax=Hugenholtzia roseola TaxID=1002 RepID=UPI000555885B|nr:PspC domain-containing protein [Hugenholtzia roseola]
MKKSTSNRILAGICGGVADFFGWEANIVRILFVLTSFFTIGLPSILIYIGLAFLMPAED